MKQSDLDIPRNAAIFIDFEGLYMALRDESQKPLEATLEMIRGMRRWLIEDCQLKLVLGRAYGTWDYSATREALHPLSLMGIGPKYVLAKRAKTGGDLKLCLDVVEVLITRPEIDTFVLLGGDKDYLALAERVREQAKHMLLIFPEGATAPDLRTMVGMENVVNGLSFVSGDLLEKPEPREETESSGPVPADDILRCAKLFLKARRELRATDIWLGPFFKSYMNEEFSSKSNQQRKEIISEMVRREVIVIEDREDRYGSGTFSVVIPNWSHDVFASVEGSETASGVPEGGHENGLKSLEEQGEAGK